MSYIVNKTDGTILTEIVDGTIDQTATDLTLIGKNSSGYGEFINENLVHLLENFASSTQPNNPITGQLWFDTSESRLKIYDGTSFKVSGGTVVANNVPSTISKGDIWIDSSRQQLYFNDGIATVLAGPVYSKSQGQSGFYVDTLIDTNEISHTVVYLFVGQSLLGIFSKTAFTPSTTIPEYTGDIKVGFNASTFTGVKFHAPVTQADSLLAADNTLKTAESFMSTTEDTSTTGSVTILNSVPLRIGSGGIGGSAEFKFENSIFKINSTSASQKFQINMLANNNLKTAFHVDPLDQYVGIYTDAPTSTLDVNGSARIRGNLTVEGNLTTISTTNVEIADKLIELAKVTNPSNSTANGGGFLVEAGSDGDKTFTWSSGVIPGGAWSSSESINLVAGKSYNINGYEILTQTTLGSTVTSAPGLNSIGKLNQLQVSYLTIGGTSHETEIRYTNELILNGDIILVPKGSGSVKVNNSLIKNLADPVDLTDAVNLQTLTYNVKKAPLALAVDTTGLTDAQIASLILDVIFPSEDHENDTICRVHCIDSGIRTNKRFELLNGAWSYIGPIV